MTCRHPLIAAPLEKRTETSKGVQDGKGTVYKMSFNMSALRASVGTIPVRQTVRTPQRSAAVSMPSFSGLGVSGRLQCGSEGDECLQ